MDIDQFYSGDLGLSSTGDLNTVDGTKRGQQRVLRRLLTNPATPLPDGTQTVADYIFHPDYGAGLGRFIGKPAPLPEIKAVILEQMAQESAVDPNTQPQVNLTWLSPVMLNCAITYVDAATGQTTGLNFNVS